MESCTYQSHIRRYVNEGNDVTAMAFKLAIERTMPYVKVIIYATPNVITQLLKKNIKLENVSSLNNFIFCNNCITVWRHEIGPGSIIHSISFTLMFLKL